MNKTSTLVAVCIAIALFLPSVIANPSFPIWNAGNTSLPDDGPEDAFLIDSNRTDLRFTSEYVFLDVNRNSFTRGDFNATYVITNSGANWINQTIALPGYSIYAEEGEFVITIYVDDASAKYWFDTVRIENIRPADVEYYCFLFNVTFQPFQTRTITADFPFTIDRYTPGNLTAKYIVTTGNSWEGSIGQADIYYRFPAVNVNNFTSIAPANYTYENESTDSITIHWHYDDWEPTGEVVVKWVPDLDLTVSLEPETITCQCNESVTVNVTIFKDGIKESNVGSYELLYDFGDSQDSGWIHSMNATHAYAMTGDYQIQVWVRYISNYDIVSDGPGVISVVVEDLAGNDSMPFLPASAIVLVAIGLAGILSARGISRRRK